MSNGMQNVNNNTDGEYGVTEPFMLGDWEAIKPLGVYL
jgi:hypothetical protein